MAHFAKLDENNNVIAVNVVNNAVLDSNDEEKSGITFLTEWSGGYSNWKQTSYNALTNGFRNVFAGIGFTYNPDEDIFIAPQPYPSWSRSGSFWNPPTPRPTEGFWTWDETSLQWQKLEN
jgi:hypothetical protein